MSLERRGRQRDLAANKIETEMLKKIISGGQTGADRAALDAALAIGIPHGGSCPYGRVAEDGVISARYNLTEIGGGYRQRTKTNVLEADGTVVFYDAYMQGGTEATALFCMRFKKPYKLIDIETVSPQTAAMLVSKFVVEYEVATLNIAGPRAGSCVRIYDFVYSVISQV